MRKLPFLSNERLSRMLVSLMLCLGLLMPLMLTFGVGDAMRFEIAEKPLG